MNDFVGLNGLCVMTGNVMLKGFDVVEIGFVVRIGFSFGLVSGLPVTRNLSDLLY